MKKNCTNCCKFVWWDGDFVCFDDGTLICESKNGNITKKVIMEAEKHEGCISHEDSTEDFNDGWIDGDIDVV